MPASFENVPDSDLISALIEELEAVDLKHVEDGWSHVDDDTDKRSSKGTDALFATMRDFQDGVIMARWRAVT